MAATIVANLLGDRDIWSAIVFALCNAGEALFIAGMLEFYFGSSLNLDRLQAARRELAEITRHTTIGAMTASIAHELR